MGLEQKVCPQAGVPLLSLNTHTLQEPWFLKLNPNGRVPVLIDHTRDDFIVFETAAILLYLLQHYDKDNKFGFPAKSNEESEMLQWIFFAVSLLDLCHHLYAYRSFSMVVLAPCKGS